MKHTKYPEESTWDSLCKRPTIETASITAAVSDILTNVRLKGDEAINYYTQKFDGVSLNNLSVSEEEIQEAISRIPKALKEAIELAKDNIQYFHTAQRDEQTIYETSEGVECWRKSLGIERVGLYIPGGTAPLFSTILMLAIPAKIAGCKEIIICTPPDKNGAINDAILYAADLVGVTEIYKVGGAQAIAALAFGTQSIKKTHKIFGPGNQYVSKAKELVQQYGVAIDLPAGPSELLVIADETCNPSFVAADLLSQAEHGIDSQVILLSTNEYTITAIETEIEIQLAQLPRKDIAKKALENSQFIVFYSTNKCLEFSNNYAPEHLIIVCKNAEKIANEVTNAGSVFIGNYSCESAGDYASGTNHTLPTNGYAKNHSGVSLDSFVKKITFQKISEIGIRTIGPSIEIMAETEDLYAHKNAVTIRLKSLTNV
ncbi:histidinol dehydrogenase [Crocinitomix catalasitica]|uniref:histidinol dehydrogenase n=1 Tax=Crocinitomix catalasitica TaxID=184607 RepID=UPI00048666CC|nr:histidinol dehydrogenase [Crocinitomix catalasitica]